MRTVRTKKLFQTHILLLMTQESDAVELAVRNRLRALRTAQGWSLDELAERAHLSASTISRIENNQRRLALDQLLALARALDTTLDQLVESDVPDVIIRPEREQGGRTLRWLVRADPTITVIRQRLTPATEAPALRAHPGREWFVVLSGAVSLTVGAHSFRVEAEQAAEFPTTTPHALAALIGPADVLGIFDRTARKSHASA